MTRRASNTGLTREFPKDIKTMGVIAPQDLVKGECTGGVACSHERLSHV
jgi:hypothetical protein